MQTKLDKNPEIQSRQTPAIPAAQLFADHRPETAALQRLQDLSAASPQQQNLQALQAKAAQSPQAQRLAQLTSLMQQGAAARMPLQRLAAETFASMSPSLQQQEYPQTKMSPKAITQSASAYVSQPVIQRQIFIGKGKKAAKINEVIEWLVSNIGESKTDSKKTGGTLADKLRDLLNTRDYNSALQELVNNKFEQISLIDQDSVWEVLDRIGIPNAQAIRDPGYRNSINTKTDELKPSKKKQTKAQTKIEKSIVSQEHADKQTTLTTSMEPSESLKPSKEGKLSLKEEQQEILKEDDVDIETQILNTTQKLKNLQQTCLDFIQIRFISAEISQKQDLVKEQLSCKKLLNDEIRGMNLQWNKNDADQSPETCLIFQNACFKYDSMVKLWEQDVFSRHPFQNHYINCIRILRTKVSELNFLA